MSTATMRGHWRTAAVLGFFLAAGAGCDSLDTAGGAGSVQGASKSAGDKEEADASAKRKKKREAEAEAAAAEAAPAAPARDNAKVQKALGQYRGCILECLDDKDAKETDREGCKLTCRSNAEAAGVDPDTAVIKIADRFELCTSECYDPKLKETDRETCKLNCETVAESLQSTLDFSTPEAAAADDSKTVSQGCARSCMHQMSKCERICDEQAGLETDRETCRLLCDSNGEICLDTCNINAAKSG